MKNIYFTILVILLTVNATACFAGGDNEMKPITGASSFFLNKSDLKMLKEKALKGDAKAAYRVYQHYALGKGDIISSFPWLQIAANGKDVSAQYVMGYTFIYVDVFKNIPLARYWLNEASRNGSIEAKKLLKEIDDLNESVKRGQ